MDRVVEAPRLIVHPPTGEHRESERPLRIRRKISVQARVVDRLPDPGDQRHELLPQPAKDRGDVGRPHAPLVVVEENVVRVVEGLVARDVLAREGESPLEMRPQKLEVGGSARLQPRSVAQRRRPRHLGT